MEWIDVCEEEPPKNKNIFALDNFGGVANVYYYDLEKKWYIETFGKWAIEFDDIITHWTEIPETPNHG